PGCGRCIPTSTIRCFRISTMCSARRGGMRRLSSTADSDRIRCWNGSAFRSVSLDIRRYSSPRCAFATGGWAFCASPRSGRYPRWWRRQSSQHHFEVKISPPRWLPSTTVMVAALAIFTVGYPEWWHREYSQHYFEVKVPPVAAHAVVLLVNDAPMAYVLPFFPPDGRFL